MKRAMSVAVADIAPAGAALTTSVGTDGCRVVGVALREARVEVGGQRLRERRRGHACAVEDLLLHELGERLPAHPLGDVARERGAVVRVRGSRAGRVDLRRAGPSVTASRSVRSLPGVPMRPAMTSSNPAVWVSRWRSVIAPFGVSRSKSRYCCTSASRSSLPCLDELHDRGRRDDLRDGADAEERVVGVDRAGGVALGAGVGEAVAAGGEQLAVGDDRDRRAGDARRRQRRADAPSSQASTSSFVRSRPPGWCWGRPEARAAAVAPAASGAVPAALAAAPVEQAASGTARATTAAAAARRGRRRRARGRVPAGVVGGVSMSCLHARRLGRRATGGGGRDLPCDSSRRRLPTSRRRRGLRQRPLQPHHEFACRDPRAAGRGRPAPTGAPRRRPRSRCADVASLRERRREVVAPEGGPDLVRHEGAAQDIRALIPCRRARTCRATLPAAQAGHRPDERRAEPCPARQRAERDGGAGERDARRARRDRDLDGRLGRPRAHREHAGDVGPADARDQLGDRAGAGDSRRPPPRPGGASRRGCEVRRWSRRGDRPRRRAGWRCCPRSSLLPRPRPCVRWASGRRTGAGARGGPAGRGRWGR